VKAEIAGGRNPRRAAKKTAREILPLCLPWTKSCLRCDRPARRNATRVDAAICMDSIETFRKNLARVPRMPSAAHHGRRIVIHFRSSHSIAADAN